jgi:Spy/CpxP family protein refolding chaperone
MRALNLTPEQRAEIARIRRETEQQSRAVGQRIRRARRALEEAIYAPAVDEGAVEERARAVAAAEAERVRLRAQTELRIRRLLTPEQLGVFRELRQRAVQRARRQQSLQPGRTRRAARRPLP